MKICGAGTIQPPEQSGQREAHGWEVHVSWGGGVLEPLKLQC